MTTGQLHQGRCKECGSAFWESFEGARGEDLCDDCYDRLHSPTCRASTLPTTKTVRKDAQ